MTLSKHVDSDELRDTIFNKLAKTPLNNTEEYVFKYDANEPVPKYEIPSQSAEGGLVYKYLEGELALDGTPSLNLASFVNTTIDDLPLKLISNNLVKNLADNDEYPALLDFQERCISIISNLWHAPRKLDKQKNKHVTTAVGTATTGSSEAIMLGGLALKKAWQERRKAAGKSTENPNILMASCAQVALEKFARYFDVENRTIRITKDSNYVIDVDEIRKNVDENTIGIFVILGSTFTGSFEPVEKIARLLDDIQKESGLDVKIHVDGASGGFVAPFVYPHLKWDFQIDRVVSINTSGHKFGLTTAGLGWIIWRDVEHLPESLRFKLDYLGGIEETFGLNFSRPGFPVIHQYYNFLTFGNEGYTKVFNTAIQNARLLSDFLEESKYFKVLSVIHKRIPSKEIADTIYTKFHHVNHKHRDISVANEEYYPGLPVVAFKFADDFREKYPEIPQSIISLLLRNKGFIVPNYHLTPIEQEQEILRVVVKDSLRLNLLQKLMDDIIESVELLIKSCETVRVLLKTKHQSEEVDKTIAYSLLVSIVSNGTSDAKAIKDAESGEQGHQKNKKSYRGAC